MSNSTTTPAGQTLTENGLARTMAFLRKNWRSCVITANTAVFTVVGVLYEPLVTVQHNPIVQGAVTGGAVGLLCGSMVVILASSLYGMEADEKWANAMHDAMSRESERIRAAKLAEDEESHS